MKHSITLVGVILLAAACSRPPILLERGSEEVGIQRGDIRLSGTLELPEADGPVPAVLFVQGSGAFDRSEMGFFDTLALRLASVGIASLRVDDRGIGGSGGVKHDLSATELAEDISALHSYLVSRQETNPRKVGLLGHSFGGALVPVVASSSKDVAFVISLAGYAVTGERLMMDGRRRTEESRDMESPVLDRILSFQQSMFDAAKTDGPWEAVEREHRAIRQIEFERMDEAARGRYKDFNSYVVRTMDDAVLQLAKTPWFKSFLALDPEPAIRSLRIPFLAIFGGGDTSVPPDLNAEPMRNALSSNTRRTVHIIPKANHLFRVSGETSEELLSAITAWLAEEVGN